MRKTTLLMAACLLAFACKKEDNNDPTITDRVVNKTITPIPVGPNFMISDYLDVDNDGKIDINFFGQITDSTKTLTLKTDNDSTLILSGYTPYASYPGGIVPTTKDVAINTLVDVSSSYWIAVSYTALVSTKKTKEINTGFHGAGDKYVALKLLKPSGQDFYAWMLINVSEDFKTILVKEVAANTTPNEGIKIGEK